MASDEQMDIIRLKSQCDDAPSTLLRFNDRWKEIMNWSDQHVSASFRASDEMVYDKMNCMLFMNILMCHVRAYYATMYVVNRFSLPIAPPQGTAFIPGFKTRAF